MWQDANSFKLRPVVEELTREEFGRWVIFRAKAMAHLNERFLADPECVSVYRRRAQEIVDERAQMG
ncbi:hypothetical protein [Dictyobacter kobayashii]|uniref:hypothetical protein n=1 Tax=Dictyobacter kobayashii TaxID=2014872 RepID=UPI000F81BEAB|nr:hypothetical protein [Dictyobacter kobayashii]